MAEPVHVDPPTQERGKIRRGVDLARTTARRVREAGSDQPAIEAARTLTHVQALAHKIPEGLTAEQTIERVMRNKDEEAVALIKHFLKTERITPADVINYSTALEDRISSTLLGGVAENVQADIFNRLRGLEAITTDALDAFARDNPTAAARGAAFRTALTEAAPDITLLRRFEQVSTQAMGEIASEVASGKTGASWFRRAMTGTPLTWLYNAAKNHPGTVGTIAFVGILYFGWDPAIAPAGRWIDTKVGITETGKIRGEVQNAVTKTAFSEEARDFFAANPYVYRGVLKKHTADELNDPDQAARIIASIRRQVAIKESYEALGKGSGQKTLTPREAEYEMETTHAMFQMEKDPKTYPAVAELRRRIEKDPNAQDILTEFPGIRFLFYGRVEGYYKQFGATSEAMERAVTRVVAELNLLKDPTVRPDLPKYNQRNLTLPPEKVQELENIFGADVSKQVTMLQNPKAQALLQELSARGVGVDSYSTLEDIVAARASGLPDGYDVEKVAIAVQGALAQFTRDQLENANVEIARSPKDVHPVRTAIDDAFEQVSAPSTQRAPASAQVQAIEPEQAIVDAVKRNYATRKTDAQILADLNGDRRALMNGVAFKQKFPNASAYTPENLDAYLKGDGVQTYLAGKKGYTLK